VPLNSEVHFRYTPGEVSCAFGNCLNGRQIASTSLRFVLSICFLGVVASLPLPHVVAVNSVVGGLVVEPAAELADLIGFVAELVAGIALDSAERVMRQLEPVPALVGVGVVAVRQFALVAYCGFVADYRLAPGVVALPFAA